MGSTIVTAMKVRLYRSWWKFRWVRTVKCERALDCISSGFGIGWNMVREDADDFMVDAIFGPFEKDEAINFFPKNWNLEDVAVSIGLFSSKGEAKKNNWGGALPEGFTKRYAKKLYRNVFLYIPPKKYLEEYGDMKTHPEIKIPFFRTLVAEGLCRLRKCKTVADVEQLRRDWKHTMKKVDKELWHESR